MSASSCPLTCKSVPVGQVGSVPHLSVGWEELRQGIARRPRALKFSGRFSVARHARLSGMEEEELAATTRRRMRRRRRKRGRPARVMMHHITCSRMGGSCSTVEEQASPYKKTNRLSCHHHRSQTHFSCHRQYPSRYMPGFLSRHLSRHIFGIPTATYPSHNAESSPLQPSISQSSRQTLSPRMDPTTSDKGNPQLREAEVH